MVKLKHFPVCTLILLASLGCLLCLDVYDEVESDENFCKRNVDGTLRCQEVNKEATYIFYDVNPPEGFNLRRDVYVRLAVLAHNIVKLRKYRNIKLVLPPWNNLYHWQSRDIGLQRQIPWGLFFDIESLRKFAPVVELYELFEEDKPLVIDRVYVLEPYTADFENEDFDDKFEVKESSSCRPYTAFWGYNNITFKYHQCIRYQGTVNAVRDIIDSHPKDKKIMLTNAEVALHDEYGTKKYWNCRKSMKFSLDLIDLAEDFIEKEFNCFQPKCDNYISVHWRRGDFARSRSHEVPSIQSTAEQVYKLIEGRYKSLIKTIFIATDASRDELEKLVSSLESDGFTVKWFTPSVDVKRNYKDGGVAIIDQIICSHAAYFLGTHESTFTFRIQEEREILGFDSETTFNRLCPNSGPCDRMSRWKIVN